RWRPTRTRAPLIPGTRIAASRNTRAAPLRSSKAGVSALAEGIRAEMTATRTPIAVTTLHPGYIATELSAGAAKTPLMTSTEKGVRTMVKAIERERPEAKVPAWPWVPAGFLMRHLPLRLITKVT
ncbi:hypothetical protein ACWCRC_41500, partial [Streptomyces sp. NPDC001940]